MTASDDLTRIHERMDALNAGVARLTSAVETNIALCQQCRPKVLGNGKEGYDARFARLEESKIDRGEARVTMLETKMAVSKTFLTLTFSAAGAVGAISGAIIRYFGG